MRFLRDIATALRVLTILPLPGGVGDRPARWFSWVGLLFGALGVGLASAAAWAGADDGPAALLVGAIVVCSWAVLSRLLHWDGLADTADALGARGDVDARLAVMRDSRTGAFGVAAIGLGLLLQTLAAGVIIDSGSWWALGAAPVLGRWAAAMALSQHRAARPEGLAASLARRESVQGAFVAALPLVALMAVRQAPERVAIVVGGVVVAVVSAWWLARRFGGVTGDVLGAVIVVVETAVLVAGALVGGLA